MSLYKPGNNPSSPFRNVLPGAPLTEFDILKASHKFLREEEEDETGGGRGGESENAADDARSWEDQLARKYYGSLYREFAICDLKHYKTGQFALRWRTETEVLEGEGDETCGNTRCEHHHRHPVEPMPKLSTVELPFAYEEHGEYKSALVKVVLCESCLRKLMWKREKERKKMEKAEKAEKKGTERDTEKERQKGKGKEWGEAEEDGEHASRQQEVDKHEHRARASDGQDWRLRDMSEEQKRDRNHRSTRPRDNHEERKRRRRNSRSRSPSRSSRHTNEQKRDPRHRRHASSPE